MLNTKWITKNQKNRLYQIHIPVIGLTGGIASGKSTIAELFRENDIPVIDADKLVKNIYQNIETIDFIKKNFPEVIDNDSIVFPRLRELAFNSLEIKTKLEKFIYSYLPSEFTKVFNQLPLVSFAIYDVPLLFEKGLDQYLDATICVYAPREIQIKRLMSRDLINFELAQKILDQQISIEEKKSKADLVIDNSGTIEQIRNNFQNLLAQLKD
jgi:dephospho-CoA kinase